MTQTHISIFRKTQIWTVVSVFLLVGLSVVLGRQNRVSAVNQGFTFATAGDFGHKPATTTPVLKSIGRSNPAFLLMLGDLSYDGKMTEKQWCAYVKNNIGNTKVQILAGNHEAGGEVKNNGFIDNFIAKDCLPNSLPGQTSGDYARQYFFDYPSNAPLARFIQVSPGVTFKGGKTYNYKKGGAGYTWLERTINQARAKGIKWVIVSNHKNYISVGNKKNEVGSDYFNLLVRKKVDLVLQGHDHTYQRSKQLALGNKCARVVANSANKSCIVDSDNNLVKGAGTTLVVSGVGGQEYYPARASDTEAPYFANFKSNTSGYNRITVSATSLKSTFVSAAGQAHTDTFSITEKKDSGSGGVKGNTNNLTQEQCTKRHLVWSKKTKKCYNQCVKGYEPAKTVAATKTPRCVKVKNNNDSGNGNGPTRATKFRIVTYNILGSNHVPEGNRIGQCGSGNSCMVSRMNQVIKAIQGKMGSAPYDIVGMQEVRKNQFDYLNKNLEGYGHSTVKNHAQTIYWNKNRFKLVNSGGIKYPYFDNNWDTAGWVKLLDKNTDKKFYVINFHAPAHDGRSHSERGGALKREKTARIISDWAEKVHAKDKLPVFMLGDINSSTVLVKGKEDAYGGNRSRLPYCIFTKSGLMRYSFDAVAGRKKPCPLNTRPKGFNIDHVIVSREVKVYRTASLSVPRASDHRPVFADVSIGKPTEEPGGNKDKTKPTVRLITPASAITIDKGMNLVAKATDADSGIEKVQFYRNSERILTDRTADKNNQYSKKWNTTKVPNGTYEVYAVATDKVGNQATSKKIKVTIDHETPQKYPQVSFQQYGKTITIGFVGQCDKGPKASTVNTPNALKSKKVVAGFTFSSTCAKAGDGMNVEISLGAVYENVALKVYKLKGKSLKDITSSVAVVDMNAKGKTTTYITYGLEDGGDFDTDGVKNKTITDPIFVINGIDGLDDNKDPENPGDPGDPGNPENPEENTSTETDGTIVRDKGADFLPNTGTSAVILGIAGATAVGATWFLRKRREKLATASLPRPNEYTVADMVQAQQNDPTVVPSKKD